MIWNTPRHVVVCQVSCLTRLPESTALCIVACNPACHLWLLQLIATCCCCCRHAQLCGWDEPELPLFQGPPDCIIHEHGNYSDRPTMSGTWVRMGSCEIQYGPLNCDFAWGKNKEVLSDELLPSVTQCGVNMPSPDMVTPARMATQVWSWAEGHPHSFRGGKKSDGAASCVALSAQNGRWYVTEQCGGSIRSACRNVQGLQTPAGVPLWILAAAGQCPDKFRPDIPHGPKENMLLTATLKQQGVASVLLPLKGPNFMPDWWSTGSKAQVHLQE